VFWVGLHALFFLWWKPGAYRFWLMALPAWCALALLGAGALGVRLRLPGVLPTRLTVATAGVIAAAVFLGAFRHEIVPTCNRSLSISRALAARTEPRDLIVLSGVGRHTALKAYVEYFARRRMLVLDWQFADKSRSPGENLSLLRERLARERGRRKVYVLSEALSQDLDEHFIRHHGVPGRDRRSVLEADRLERTAELDANLFLLELKPQP
jgi:hypothetical protein